MKKYIALVFAAVASFFVSPVKAQTYCSPDWLGPDYNGNRCKTYPTCTGAPQEWCRSWAFIEGLTIPSMESMVNYCMIQNVPESTKHMCYYAYCYGRQDAILEYYNCIGAIKYPDRIEIHLPSDYCLGTVNCDLWGVWYRCSAMYQCQSNLLAKLSKLKSEFCDCLVSQTSSTDYHAVETVDDSLFYLLP